MLYFAVGSNDLLDNLDSPWRWLGGLVHLLRLQLDHLGGGLRLLGVDGDGLDAALDNLLLLLLWLGLDLLLSPRTSASLGSSGIILGKQTGLELSSLSDCPVLVPTCSDCWCCWASWK